MRKSSLVEQVHIPNLFVLAFIKRFSSVLEMKALNVIIVTFLSLASGFGQLIRLQDLDSTPYSFATGGAQDQNPQPTFLASGGGYEIRMVNSWKRLRLKDLSGNDLDSANVGPNTVLSFEVKFGSGNGIPEFACVGLDSDNVFNNDNRIFVLHQGDDLEALSRNRFFSRGVADSSWYHEVEDGWFRYSIPVGEELSPYAYNSLVLICDDDGTTGNGKIGNVSFRDVRIYENEGSPSFSSVYVGEDAWVDGNVVLGGQLVDRFGNLLLSGGVDGLVFENGFSIRSGFGSPGYISAGGQVEVGDSVFLSNGFTSGHSNSVDINGQANFFGDNNEIKNSSDIGAYVSANVFVGGNFNSYEFDGFVPFTSFALGDFNEIRKSYFSSYVIGYRNIVPVDVEDDFAWTFVMGANNEIRNNSLVLGWGNVAKGSGTTTLGLGLSADAYNCTYVGRYNEMNDEAPRVQSAEPQDDVPVFVVGNGENSRERSTAFEVRQNGDVIISKSQGDISMGIFGQ